MGIFKNELIEKQQQETKELREKYETHECSGNPAEPWNYCEICTEYQTYQEAWSLYEDIAQYE